MATVNRPNAPQDYRSPPELLAAVQARFGRITFDAACTLDNAVAGNGYTWPQYDALERDWRNEPEGCVVRSNQRFDTSGHLPARTGESQPSTGWTSKALYPPDNQCQACGGAPTVLLLVPAPVGTSRFAQPVHGQALVLALSPRVKF